MAALLARPLGPSALQQLLARPLGPRALSSPVVVAAEKPKAGFRFESAKARRGSIRPRRAFQVHNATVGPVGRREETAAERAAGVFC